MTVSQSQPCGEASADAEVFAGLAAEPSAAFTPGPWEVGGARGYANLSGVNVTTRRWGLVLAVAIGDVPELHADANARLIAAAPELLAALIAALPELEAGVYEEDGPPVSPAAKVARAAIAKALGAAPASPASAKSQAPDEPK